MRNVYMEHFLLDEMPENECVRVEFSSSRESTCNELTFLCAMIVTGTCSKASVSVSRVCHQLFDMRSKLYLENVISKNAAIQFLLDFIYLEHKMEQTHMHKYDIFPSSTSRKQPNNKQYGVHGVE